MSARSTSFLRISRPSAVFRFSVTLFTPRLLVSKYVLGKPGSTVEPRELSPISGTSILITSAPRSAISMYGTVPACAVEQATTLTPWSGPWGAVMSNNLRCFAAYCGYSAVPAPQCSLYHLPGHGLARRFRRVRHRRGIGRRSSISLAVKVAVAYGEDLDLFDASRRAEFDDVAFTRL